jgi:hypothetical protein
MLSACSEIDFSALPQSPGSLVGEAIKFIDAEELQITTPEVSAGAPVDFMFGASSQNIQAFYEQAYVASESNPSEGQWVPIEISSFHNTPSNLEEITTYTFLFPNKGSNSLAGTLDLPDALVEESYKIYFAEWEWVGSEWDLNWIIKDITLEPSTGCDTPFATRCDINELLECNGGEWSPFTPCIEYGCTDEGDGNAYCNECAPGDAIYDLGNIDSNILLRCNENGKYDEVSCGITCDESSGTATCIGGFPGGEIGFPPAN